MLYTIHNEYLTVKIQDKGAMLWSLQDREGTEYLWQGNEKYWGNRAPNLFPYIARMTNGQYKLQGKTYHMDIHGFAKDMIFKAEPISDSHIVFSITHTEETYAQYPFQFCFSIIYKLEGSKLSVAYYVRNDDEKTMYFGVGGHPGFNVPLEDGTVFEDYYLEFDTVKEAKRVDFSEDCFVTGELTAFTLGDGVRLPLSHDMFDEDAIVLTDMASGVALKSQKGNKGVRVTYPNMSYLGIWHMPKTDAPYVCIEPWSSLPSRKDVIEDLETQPGLVMLEAKCEYENMFTIEVVKG
jgi:galactose mutarotase-like enzyme